MNHMPLKRRNRIALPVAAIPAMALCLLAPTTSFAAESDAPAHVIVEAARVTRKVVGRTDIGAPIELMSLRAHVKYSDLDLATSAGAAALKGRVSEAARLACLDLDKMYPLLEPDPECARRATDDAAPQVKAAVARAEAKSRAGR